MLVILLNNAKYQSLKTWQVYETCQVLQLNLAKTGVYQP